MSRAVKSVAAIALPIAGAILLPGVGGALGAALSTTLGAAGTAALGGALGGAAGGAISGGGVKNVVKGGVIGGVGGYLSAGGLTQLGITGPGSLLGEVAQPGVEGAGLTGAPIAQGSGALGAITQYLPSSVLSAGALIPGAIVAGNVASGVLGANAAEKAAKLQYQSTQDALAQSKELTSPYVNAGSTAVNQYQSLISDPKAQSEFIQNNPFYNNLAEDAKRRLLATQASSGKVASGGTANELQTQLLTLGNGLLQGHLTNLQNTINTGANAATGQATNNSNLITAGGNAQSAGTIGAYNAGNSAYQNTVNSLLALQKLKQPNVNVYQPYSLNS